MRLDHHEHVDKIENLCKIFTSQTSIALTYPTLKVMIFQIIGTNN